MLILLMLFYMMRRFLYIIFVGNPLSFGNVENEINELDESAIDDSVEAEQSDE